MLINRPFREVRGLGRTRTSRPIASRHPTSLRFEPLEERTLLATLASDAFDGTSIDTDQWEVVVPSDASSVIQDDALFLTNDGAAGAFSNTPGNRSPGAGVGSVCKLSGDFDIQVDFRDFSGPDADWSQAFFSVYQDAANQAAIKRIRGAGFDGIQTFSLIDSIEIQTDVTATSTTSGTLRIVRTGDRIDTFFDEFGAQPNYSETAFSGDVVVTLTLLAPGGADLAYVTYDDFLINSGTAVCPIIDAAIDIKPGNDTNPINLKSNGVLAVAILTTSIADGDTVDFDATTVDTATIEFGDTRDGFVRVDALRTAVEDVDGDGDLDLIAHFSIREIRDNGALDEDSVDAILSADTLDGTEIIGIDSVQIVPKRE